MVTTWKKNNGKTPKSVMQEVTTGMGVKRINSKEWIDIEKWRRKIKLKF